MMKHQLAYTLILLSFCTHVHGQNSSPYWSVYGNSNATTYQKVGTTNAYPLRLITNNSTRIYIGATNGYVGIGTTSPSARLHVNAASGTSPLKVAINGSYKLYVGSNGYVGIGTTTPTYPLHVNGGANTAIYGTSSGSYGVYGNSSYLGVYGNGGTYGVFGYSSNYYGVYGSSPNYGVYGNGSNYGVYGYTANSSGYAVYGNGANYGVYGYTTGNYGVFGNAGTVGVYGTGGSYGVFGNASTSNGYGVYGQGGYYGVYGSGSTFGLYGYSGSQYGVYGYTGGGGSGNPSGVYGYNNSYGYGVAAYCRYGSGIFASSGGTYAGYFAGAVYSGGGYVSSDRKLKKNITDVTSAMDLIGKLQPKSYEFRQDGNYKLLNLPQGRHYGLIAQDLEPLLPGLVKETEFDTRLVQAMDSTGKPVGATQPSEKIDFKAVNYTELIPIMIKGMQEQQKKIDELQALVNKLLQERGITTSTGTLSQNAPNPAKNTTRISYALPANTSRGQLLLTDNLGKTIRVVSLNTAGVVDINTAALSSGVYNYSLMADGKMVETRKMEVVR